MRNVQAEVRRWLLQQPEWLQAAASTLLKNGHVTDTEIEKICSLLKSPAGQLASETRLFHELAESTRTSSDLRLVRIGNVEGIENISPRRPLEFGTTNLVVVYGHNGAGKSGFARILKKAAGKPRAASLRTNVFKPAVGKRSCQITISTESVEQTIGWDPEGDPIESLRAVDVFDSDEAAHYLSRESAASYSPPVLAMFVDLAQVCDRVKNALQKEQDLLVSALPRLPAKLASTPAAIELQKLSASTSPVQMENLVRWTTRDESDLELLRGRLKEVDPAAVAQQKRNLKRQAEKIVAAIERDAMAYGSEGLERIRALRSDASVKRAAAQEAGLLSTAKLDGIGSESWIELWTAAKKYSTLPYPGKKFPVTDGDARCVLCQQELADSAVERMRDFERFVEGTLSANADVAEAAYKTALDALPSAKEEDVVRTQIQAAALASPQLGQSIVDFWQEAANARIRISEEEANGAALPVRSMAPAISEVRSYCEQLEKQALACDEDARSLDRPKLEKDALNLEARLWLSQQAPAIAAELDRLKSWKRLESWKSASNSRPVSVKAGEVSAEIITQDYVRRFNRELQALGANRLKVELVRTRAERGKALHRLQLVGAKQAAAVELILSEGERRVVSLAAFLADVAEKAEPSPFLFDDPISSLDQRWEERTAARLVELSVTRQVIVFTHRLSMLSHLAESGTVVHIRQEPWGAGEPGEVPLYGKAPEKALNDLKDRRLAQARNALQEAGTDGYYPLAKAICSDFRVLIERFVELHFLADVIQRHRREVNTKGKIHNLLKLTEADCDLINELMSKYSCYEHSQPDEAPVELPDPDELSADMKKLADWYLAFKAR